MKTSPSGDTCPARARDGLTRRKMLKDLGATVAAAVAMGTPQSRGAEPVRLDPKDPAAVALGYVEDAGRVDAKKYPEFAPGSNCENCLQLQGRAGDNYRPCSLFPGKLVSVSGWCKGWTPEM